MSAVELLDEDAEETLLTDAAIEKLVSASAPGCFFCLVEGLEDADGDE